MKQLITSHTLIVHDAGAPVALENYAVCIEHDQIVDILPNDEALALESFDIHHNMQEHVVSPGLINAHGHAAMTLLRGYSDDKPLKTWLTEDIWPAENQWLGDDFVRDGTQLAMAEMLMSGTTCFSDMYFFTETAAETIATAGLRAQLAFPIVDFPSNWGNGPNDYLEKGLALHDHYKNSELLHIAFGPHSPYTVSDELMHRIATLANELETPIHIHLHETQQEVNDSLAQYGKRPIERLFDLGVLNAKTQCIHMTALNEADIATLRNSLASVVHCPQSNQKLASGCCPINELISKGINVGIGTDGAASNNSLNLFSELKTASLLAKHETKNPAALAASTAFNMATLAGAKALGLDHLIGSIEIGKKADVIAIPRQSPAMQPLYSPLSQLVYAEPKPSHVWVSGKLLLDNGELTTLNLQHILHKAQFWANKIRL